MLLNSSHLKMLLGFHCHLEILPFSSTKIFQNILCLSLEFCSKYDNDIWVLSNIYAPCTTQGKREFLTWFKNVQMPDFTNWLLVGDFNLYRSPADRNKPRGDHTEMYLFNEAISALGLIELPLKGRRFTWTNKQLSPLLERLDWFFTSANWTISYPTTYVYPLVMETYDHVPCVISISTSIPRRSIFCFKIFWLEHHDFMNVVQQGWVSPTHITDAAKAITTKFKTWEGC